MEIKRDKSNYVLYVNQFAYVKKVLEKLSMIESKTVSLPIINHFKLSSEQSPKTDKEFDRMEKYPMQKQLAQFCVL